MTFEQLMIEINKVGILPDMAIRELPSVLSDKTKKQMLNREPKELAGLLSSAIDRINHGSIESVDELMKKLL